MIKESGKVSAGQVYVELSDRISKIEGGGGGVTPSDRQKLDAIPASASSSNPVALAANVPDITDLTQRVTAVEGDINDIQGLIPSGASSSNKLATIDDTGKTTYSLKIGISGAEQLISFDGRLPDQLTFVCVALTIGSNSWTLIDGEYIFSHNVDVFEHYPLTLSLELPYMDVPTPEQIADYNGIVRAYVSNGMLNLISKRQPTAQSITILYRGLKFA